jgi:hypothetical protein
MTHLKHRFTPALVLLALVAAAFGGWGSGFHW